MIFLTTAHTLEHEWIGICKLKKKKKRDIFIDHRHVFVCLTQWGQRYPYLRETLNLKIKNDITKLKIVLKKNGMQGN